MTATYKQNSEDNRRRILTINKRLEHEFGERIAERRGWHWALTSFALEAWGATQKNQFDK